MRNLSGRLFGWGLVGLALGGGLVLGQLPAHDTDLDELLRKAGAVMERSNQDFVAAAKDAGAVFAAAAALEEKGDAARAADYYRQGLQLSPWRLEEQLSYAEVLRKLKREDEAVEIGEMVLKRAETDALANAALRLLGWPPVTRPPLWKGGNEGPWLCFIRIGPVEDVVLKEAMDRISRTLGLPAFLVEEPIGLPKADRSALDRWVEKQVIPAFRWQTPALRGLLQRLGAEMPSEVPPRQLLKALIARMREDGVETEAVKLEAAMLHQLKWDQQWKASGLIDLVERYQRATPTPGAVSIIGVTAADLYDNDSNFLFGVAMTGLKVAVTSYARYTGEFNQEPPERKRLLARLHKQLLSGIGYGLGVPRPTDPTSARAYPASLGEHDAKSEYMSATCVAGFEKALKRKLPMEALPPERRGPLRPKE